MPVVMISGKQGSGKTTLGRGLAGYLLDHGLTVWVEKFAEPVYALHDAVYEAAKKYGIPPCKKDGRLLQLIGTEWGRNSIGPDVWVNAMQTVVKRRLEEDQKGFVIIDDLRFKNEFDGFPDAYKIRLMCDRDTRKDRADAWRDAEDHPSETDLDDYDRDDLFDAVIWTSSAHKSQTLEVVKIYLQGAGLLSIYK